MFALTCLLTVRYLQLLIVASSPLLQTYASCNYLYRARRAQVHSKLDQVNLKLSVEKWKTDCPRDNFFFCECADIDAVSPVSKEFDADEDVLLVNPMNVQGLLFCHQTEWQRRLLMRYGNEICLLDATYKTSRYALPLFFVCVRTNVNYIVVTSFIEQSETTAAVAEALEILKEWNPDWNPRNWMVDFSEIEIKALESVFAGCKVLCVTLFVLCRDKVQFTLQ